jgi:hypothetical protein
VLLHDLTANANSKERAAMGNVVGVFTNIEVRELDEDDKALLKEHILHHIQTSAEIRRIIHANPKLVTRNRRIRKILRTKAGALHKRLKKKVTGKSGQGRASRRPRTTR